MVVVQELVGRKSDWAEGGENPEDVGSQRQYMSIYGFILWYAGDREEKERRWVPSGCLGNLRKRPTPHCLSRKRAHIQLAQGEGNNRPEL